MFFSNAFAQARTGRNSCLFTLGIFMKKLNWKMLCVVWFTVSLAQAQPTTCPDSNSGALQQGEIPLPWQFNPFSEQVPKKNSPAQFYRATILVAGYGRGVTCAYKDTEGYYSIWWQVNVKIPAPIDYAWRDTLGGFECTGEREGCVFYPASR